MNKKFLALARLIMKFSEVKTDKGSLILEGELTLDAPVQIEDADGNVVAAPDDTYTLEDGRVVVVKDGKVAEIKDAPVEEETVEEALEEVTTEEPTKDEKDLRIEELEGLLKDRDAVIEELTAKIKELEDKLNAPVEEAVEVKASAQCKYNNNFNKYFN